MNGIVKYSPLRNYKAGFIIMVVFCILSFLNVSALCAQELKGSSDLKPKIEKLEAVVEQNPSDAESRYRLGLYYMEDDDCTRAIGEFQTIVGQKPEAPEPYLRLGQCYEKINNPDSAFVYYDKFAGMTKNKSELKGAKDKLSQIGAKLFIALKPALDADTGADRRVALLEKALLYKPSETRYFEELLIIYESKGMLAEASNLIQRRLNAVDEDKDMRYKLKKKISGFKDTIAWINQMNSENSAKSHALLGKYYSDYDKDTAQSHFESAKSLDPEFAMLYPEIGLFYLRNNKLAKSEEVFEKYVELEGDTGKQAFARRFINAIQLEKKAENAKELNELGVLYSKLDAVKSVSVFERLVREFPEDRNGLYNLASLYEKTERNEDALGAWNRYSELNPADKDARSRINRLERLFSVYRFDSDDNTARFWKEWQAESGNWKIEDRMLTVQGDGILTYRKPIKNGLSFKLISPKGHGWWSLTIALNSKASAGDGYRLIITRSNAQIKKNWQLIVEKNDFSATPEPDNEYNIKAVNDGNNVNLYVDNKLILGIVRDEYITGDKMGIITGGNAQLRIESIKVE